MEYDKTVFVMAFTKDFRNAVLCNSVGKAFGACANAIPDTRARIVFGTVGILMQAKGRSIFYREAKEQQERRENKV